MQYVLCCIVACNMQQKYNPTNTIENGDRKYGRGTILVYYIDLWHQCRQTD